MNFVDDTKHEGLDPASDGLDIKDPNAPAIDPDKDPDGEETVTVKKNELGFLKRRAAKADELEKKAPATEDTVRQVLAEEKAVEELKQKYPDLDIEEVKNKAKAHNLPLTEAAKLLAPDPATSPSVRSMGGKPASTRNSITQKELDSLPQHEYTEMRNKIRSGEVTLR